MNCRLRALNEKDVMFMLEWMHDDNLNKFFVFDAKSSTKETVLNFILNAQNSEDNVHLAIVDETDEYLGTISLKNINSVNRNAEYAISLRKKAIGSGVASYATKEIIRFAFEELNLYKIYLNVLSDNLRAIKFYEKFGFLYEGEFRNHIIKNGENKSLKWFAIFNNRKGNSHE